MKVILKSGVIIPNVKSTDRTRSPVGLWVWASRQARDELLSFEDITIRASEIAAIIGEEEDNSYQDSLNKATKLFEQPKAEINITDDDLSF